jgi:hypothetical protein
MPHKEQLPNSRRDPVSRMILGPWENSIVFLNCGYPARTHPFDSEEGPCLAGKGFRGHACRFGLAGATYLYLKSKHHHQLNNIPPKKITVGLILTSISTSAVIHLEQFPSHIDIETIQTLRKFSHNHLRPDRESPWPCDSSRCPTISQRGAIARFLNGLLKDGLQIKYNLGDLKRRCHLICHLSLTLGQQTQEAMVHGYPFHLLQNLSL